MYGTIISTHPLSYEIKINYLVMSAWCQMRFLEFVMLYEVWFSREYIEVALFSAVGGWVGFS